MKKIWIAALFWAFSISFAFSASSVKLYEGGIYVSKTPSVTLSALYRDSGDDGTSASSPIKVYVPIVGDLATYRSRTTLSASLIPTTAGIGSEGGGYLLFNLQLTNTEMLYLHAVAKLSDGSYDTVELVGAPLIFTNVTDQVSTVAMDLNTLITTGSWFDSATVGANSAEILVYFFMSSEMSVGEAVNIANYPDGLFVKVYMSDQLPSGEITIEDVRTGDGRLHVSFLDDYPPVTQMGTNFYYKTLFFNYTGMDGGGNKQYSTITAMDTERSGEVTLAGLEPFQTYYIAASFQNKFMYYSTPSPDAKEGRTDKIDPLLEKTACYMLTAGFKSENFIVNYFRGFRDHVLKKFSLGQEFIDWYYRSAPAYAKRIWESPLLSFAVRLSAYFIFFMMNIFPLIIVGFLILRTRTGRSL